MFAISQPDTSFEPGPQDTLALLLVGVARCADQSIPEVKSARHNAIAWLVQAARMGLDPQNVRIFCAPMITLAELAEAMLAWDLERELKIRVLWIFGEMSHRARPPKDQDSGWDLLVSIIESRIADQDFDAVRALLPLEQLLLDLFPEYSHALADGFALTRLAYTVARERRRGLDTARAQADADRLGVLLARAKSPDDDFAAQEVRSLRRFLRKLDGREHSLADLMLYLCHALDPGNYDPATPEPILKHLKEIRGAGSRGLFAYTGHGQLGGDGRLELVTEHTARVGEELTDLLRVDDFKDALGESADRWTLVLDTCHAGGPGALQGSRAVSGWTRAGLDARIIAASNEVERAAEARFRHETLGAMTWALTTTLSRWLPVNEGAGRAMGVSNGNLVLRANMLLEALSLNQRISVSAPAPEKDAPHVRDLPFLGYERATLTSVDPNEQVGGIEIRSENDEVFALCFNSLSATGGWGPPQAVILSFGSSRPEKFKNNMYFFKNSGAPSGIQNGFTLWVLRDTGTTGITELHRLKWNLDEKEEICSITDSGDGHPTTTLSRVHKMSPSTDTPSVEGSLEAVKIPFFGKNDGDKTYGLGIQWGDTKVTFHVSGELRFDLSTDDLFKLSTLTSNPSSENWKSGYIVFREAEFSPTASKTDSWG